MILPDVNVLLYSHRADSPDHVRFRRWLEGVINSEEPFALSELVLSGFLRVATHPRIFSPPTPLAHATEFASQLRDQPNAVLVAPGDRHWEIFSELCLKAQASGNLIADAYLAALAIESGTELVTTDRDYARFRLLRWRHPFDHSR